MSLISPPSTRAHVPAWPLRNYLCTAIIKIGPEQMRKKRYLWRVWLGFRLPLLVAAAARTPCFTQSAILPHAHTCANTGARADAPHLLSALVASSDPVFTKLTQIPFFIFLSREFFSVMEFCTLCENIYFHKCLSACMLICTCIPMGEFVCVC